MIIFGVDRFVNKVAAIIVTSILWLCAGSLAAQQHPGLNHLGPGKEAAPTSGHEMETISPEYTTNGELSAVAPAPVDHPTDPAARKVESVFGAGAIGFYLTNASYSTDQVLTACAPGYHMASMWELLDPSNLAYAYDHPEAHTKADSGYGPPSGWYGWVRSGGSSSGSTTAGTGNCVNWSTTVGTDSAASVRLSTHWETPGELTGVWEATSFGCNVTGPVWCVSDRPTGIFWDGFESSDTSAWSATSP